MRIDRRLTFVGIMLIVLSMTMATQYTSTRLGFEYSIVNPADADIRFIACDNSSDNITVLRLVGANGTGVKLHLGGNFSANMNKTYTAAFAIVNEETFRVNITNINVSTIGATADYLQIWLHKNRTQKATTDGGVWMWNCGASKHAATSTAWVLGAGNNNPLNMNGTNAATTWTDHNVRYSRYNGLAINGTSDFVWVQVNIKLPASPDATTAHTGAIYIHFQSFRSF